MGERKGERGGMRCSSASLERQDGARGRKQARGENSPEGRERERERGI